MFARRKPASAHRPPRFREIKPQISKMQVRCVRLTLKNQQLFRRPETRTINQSNVSLLLKLLPAFDVNERSRKPDMVAVLQMGGVAGSVELDCSPKKFQASSISSSSTSYPSHIATYDLWTTISPHHTLSARAEFTTTLRRTLSSVKNPDQLLSDLTHSPSCASLNHGLLRRLQQRRQVQLLRVPLSRLQPSLIPPLLPFPLRLLTQQPLHTHINRPPQPNPIRRHRPPKPPERAHPHVQSQRELLRSLHP
jgi:hypothetical protein